MSLVAMLRCNTSSNFLSFALVFWLHNFVSSSLWLLRRAEYWLDGKTDKPVLFMLGPTYEVIHYGFQMDSELNSMSQNSPFFAPRCKIQVWVTIGQGDRPPTDQVVKTPAPYLFTLFHSRPSPSSASDLQGLLSTYPHGAACPQDLFFWDQQVVETYKLHWQKAKRTSPHCSNTRACQSE